jgi:hypothetical protein
VHCQGLGGTHAVVLSLGVPGVDFAQPVKLYAANPENETRYSPAEWIGCKATPIFGDPDESKIRTSMLSDITSR